VRAARDGDCAAVRILLAANADADSQNMVQFAKLSAQSQNVMQCKLLCIQEGRTALMEAARAGNEVIVQMLINAGANENLRDKVKCLSVYTFCKATALTQGLHSLDRLQRAEANQLCKHQTPPAKLQ
jgi:ankyrin repeat protein